MIRISNSSKDKFFSCNRRYFYHYKERLRTPRLGSALFFGTALDEAFSRLLVDLKTTPLTEYEEKLKSQSPEEWFDHYMRNGMNEAGQPVEIPKSNLIDYYTSDFNSSLLTSKDLLLIQEMEPAISNKTKVEEFHSYCKYNLNYRNKDRKRLEDNEFVLYNFITWLSLYQKGLLMLQAYKTDIIPKIDKVYSIQDEVELKSDLGDVIAGKIDFIASFKDNPDRKVICDNKTSSKAYKDDSVCNSEQLSTYSAAKGIEYGAYCVVQKEVFKKVPFIRTQIIIDKIPQEMIEKTLDIYSEACETIEKAGDDINNYPKNENDCFSFGRMCPYYAICKHGNKEFVIDCGRKTEE